MLVFCGSKELINAVEWHCFHLFRFIRGVLMPCFYNFRRMHPQKRIQFIFQIFGPTTRFVRTNSHYDVTPRKRIVGRQSFPLRKVTFQGGTVKLQVGSIHWMCLFYSLFRMNSFPQRNDSIYLKRIWHFQVGVFCKRNYQFFKQIVGHRKWKVHGG